MENTELISRVAYFLGYGDQVWTPEQYRQIIEILRTQLIAEDGTVLFDGIKV